jgi:hypothetical protein
MTIRVEMRRCFYAVGEYYESHRGRSGRSDSRLVDFALLINYALFRSQWRQRAEFTWEDASLMIPGRITRGGLRTLKYRWIAIPGMKAQVRSKPGATVTWRSSTPAWQRQRLCLEPSLAAAARTCSAENCGMWRRE